MPPVIIVGAAYSKQLIGMFVLDGFFTHGFGNLHNISLIKRLLTPFQS
jgi:hypothetical protein